VTISFLWRSPCRRGRAIVRQPLDRRSHFRGHPLYRSNCKSEQNSPVVACVHLLHFFVAKNSNAEPCAAMQASHGSRSVSCMISCSDIQ
jgi:hypothetical protein